MFHNHNVKQAILFVKHYLHEMLGKGENRAGPQGNGRARVVRATLRDGWSRIWHL